MSSKFASLYKLAESIPPIPVAIVSPESKVALEGAVLAAKEKSIVPILVGELKSIQRFAASINVDISAFQCVDVPAKGIMPATIDLAKAGKIKAIMKGSLHTDELMGAIVSSESGMRTSRRMSHCMIIDIPAYHKILILTDAALNINPVFKEKKNIIQNAVDLAHSMGIALPKVALVTAAETITENMPETFEYAALCKMAERGQIEGALLDGPLSLDLAISPQSVATKKMASKVAGDADILVVPNIAAGNILTKALDYFANALTFGLILGAKIPIVLTSRSADAKARAGSAMLAKFYATHNK